MTRSRARRPPAPVAVVWQATEPIPGGMRAWLSRLLAGYLAALGHAGGGVTLLVGGDALLRRLNARHRGLARPTDILSFAYADARFAYADARAAGKAKSTRKASARTPRAELAGELIGELALSLDRARAQAKANGWSLRTELARLLAHGCAHLAGYDHRTRAQDARMRRVEEALLDAAGFAGLYPPAAPRRAAMRRPQKRKRP